jgi:hypothetical protein
MMIAQIDYDDLLVFFGSTRSHVVDEAALFERCRPLHGV